MHSSLKIHGFVLPGYELVLSTFKSHFVSNLEIGSSCAIFVNGDKVVDLWAGFSQVPSKRKPNLPSIPWDADTLVNIYSSTKALTNMCVMVLVERGLVAYTSPVATYWPEFGCAGKEQVTVEQLLSHQAAVAYLDEAITYQDVVEWDKAVREGRESDLSRRLAQQVPNWPISPGRFAKCFTIMN